MEDIKQRVQDSIKRSIEESIGGGFKLPNIRQSEEAENDEKTQPKDLLISIHGFNGCPYFEKSVQMAREAFKEFPDRMKPPNIHFHKSRQDFQSWLKDQKVIDGKGHRTSPFVWVGNSEFIGGSDKLFDWFLAKFPNAKFLKRF
eukprot:TRINITY_DN6260_c0_g1_i2.p1 TRINITY_DN6260_c0_g1~~TRINITY_DN6260_c0_g1_i2.p1  ORF type:complete len:144 (+),score=38.56 TRINITY_DN6260_c0_g1_i2:492-923(+)